MAIQCAFLEFECQVVAQSVYATVLQLNYTFSDVHMKDVGCLILADML